MGENQKNDRIEYDLDKLIRSSYGLSDNQLLEKMERAEQTISDSQIPHSSEDEFLRLTAKAENLGITPVFENPSDADDSKSESNTEKRKVRRIGPVIKVALVAAIAGSMLLMTSITVGAKKAYQYVARDNEDLDGKVVINNNELNKESISALNDAYEKINLQLGIKALKMRNKLSNMRYLKTAMNDRQATMYFELDGEQLLFVQKIRTTENSANISSNRNLEESIYNDWLHCDIAIEKAPTDDGKEEYSCGIVLNNGYYYLSAITDVETFKKIVQDLKFSE